MNIIDFRAWVIRAGKNSEAHELFLKERIVSLKDPGIGDLKHIPANRKAFYDAYRICDPHNTQTGISGIGGKFYRFIHEIKLNDMVLFPSLIDKNIYAGYVTSEYVYCTKKDPHFSHQRHVDWKHLIEKRQLSIWASREMNAARTLFEYKKNLSEVINLLSNSIYK